LQPPFIGTLKDLVKNIWVIDWVVITYIGIVSWAFIAGSIWQILIFHILIDYSFSIVGLIPLLITKNGLRN